VNLDKREMMDFVDVENGDFPRERERERRLQTQTCFRERERCLCLFCYYGMIFSICVVNKVVSFLVVFVYTFLAKIN
jgi:hypothetical protein